MVVVFVMIVIVVVIGSCCSSCDRSCSSIIRYHIHSFIHVGILLRSLEGHLDQINSITLWEGYQMLLISGIVMMNWMRMIRYSYDGDKNEDDEDTDDDYNDDEFRV